MKDYPIAYIPDQVEENTFWSDIFSAILLVIIGFITLLFFV